MEKKKMPAEGSKYKELGGVPNKAGTSEWRLWDANLI